LPTTRTKSRPKAASDLRSPAWAASGARKSEAIRTSATTAAAALTRKFAGADVVDHQPAMMGPRKPPTFTSV
jgi:hypothetical protein